MEKIGDKEEIKGIGVIIRELEKAGYKIFKQAPDQDSIEIEGRSVSLPFTNMSGLTVILKKEGGEWRYYYRATEDELDYILRALHKDL